MDAFTRAWDEWLAQIADATPGGVPTLILVSFFAAILIGLAWAFWPAWLPWNWRLRRRVDRSREKRERSRRDRERRWRLGRLRWRLRWRRRRRATTEPDEPLPDDQVPDLPADVLALTADQLAAAGRFAEAVRERLRAMLRLLIERGLLPSGPGWTVMELADAGARARPSLRLPLSAAADVFSQIWYGLRPATAADDTTMREHAAAVAAVAAEPEPQVAAAHGGPA